MMKIINRVLLSVCVVSFTTACSETIANTTQYSELSGAQCNQTIIEEVTGSTADKCPAPNGYYLNVLYDDNRMSIDVITPDDRNFPLNYWDIISDGFSNITGQAEWRMAPNNGNSIPVALITQFDVTDNSNIDEPRKDIYYVISKITPNEICITNKVTVSNQDDDAHNQAIKLADNAISQPCLSTK